MIELEHSIGHSAKITRSVFFHPNGQDFRVNGKNSSRMQQANNGLMKIVRSNLIGLAQVFLDCRQRLLEIDFLSAKFVSFGLQHVFTLLLFVEPFVVVVDVCPKLNKSKLQDWLVGILKSKVNRSTLVVDLVYHSVP